MKVVYVAGPFRAKDGWLVRENIHSAERAARLVAAAGAMPLVPHSIGANMQGTETDVFWIEGTLELMRRCDAVLVLPNYTTSLGTMGEIQQARNLNKPIFLPCWNVEEREYLPDYESLRAWLATGIEGTEYEE